MESNDSLSTKFEENPNVDMNPVAEENKAKTDRELLIDLSKELTCMDNSEKTLTEESILQNAKLECDNVCAEEKRLISEKESLNQMTKVLWTRMIELTIEVNSVSQPSVM